jgi:CubicO group peptidase (beta-lactamase class C family)
MNKTLILLLLRVFAFGQQSDSLQLEKYIEAFASVNGFSGTILVVKNNKPIIQKTYGFADLKKKIPNIIDTKFRIASCSKQFTAIAILQLQEKGKLSVSDRLSQYFPEIPKSDSITIDMLLTHRSGIGVYTKNDSKFTKRKLLHEFVNVPPDFSPGTKYQYSNEGYFILGAVVEKVSNLSFDEYLRINIFDKAGMSSSGGDKNDLLISNKAKGYVAKNGKLIQASFDNMETLMGSGNLYSTVNDIYKYYRALEDSLLLNSRSRQQFLTPPPGNMIRAMTPASGAYACGIIADTLEKRPFFTHGGSLYGFTSDITFFFEEKAVFVVLSNNEESPAWNLSQGLRAILFHIPVINPYKYKEIKVESKSLAKFVGQYGGIKIYIKRAHLYLNDTAGPEGEIELKPETETKFFFENENNRQVEFSLDKDNKVVNSWIIASGIKYKMKQIE